MITEHEVSGKEKRDRDAERQRLQILAKLLYLADEYERPAILRAIARVVNGE